MTIPSYPELMLPILEIIQNQKEWKLSIIISNLIEIFSLTEEEKELRVRSGKGETIFSNRVYWSRLHMKIAELIKVPRRGYIQITNRGLDVLEENPKEIDLKYLEKYQKYRDYRNRLKTSKKIKTEESKEKPKDGKTPEEIFEEIYDELRTNLSLELLSEIKNRSPKDFEYLVLDVLSALGYGTDMIQSKIRKGGPHDQGIDGIIIQDPLALDNIYIQAKRWENPVGSAIIDRFAGSCKRAGAIKGVILTTSNFTEPAKQAAEEQGKAGIKIALIDGDQLVQIMIDKDIGVKLKDKYIIKEKYDDYFESLSENY